MNDATITRKQWAGYIVLLPPRRVELPDGWMYVNRWVTVDGDGERTYREANGARMSRT